MTAEPAAGSMRPSDGTPAGDAAAPHRSRGTVAAADPIRAALAQLAEGVIVTDATGRITFVNEAAARLHGVDSLDVSPARYTDAFRLYTEDGQPYPSTELPLARAVLQGDTLTDARWRIRRPDGSEVLAVGSARPLLGADGERVGAVLTVRDDSPRAPAAAAARERDRLADQLRAAFEQAPVSTVVFDRAGRPLAANPAFRHLWGGGIEDTPPGYSVRHDPQLAAAGVLPLVERAFAGDSITLPPLRYDMADAIGQGRSLWTQAHLYPVRDASGAVEQVILTHEDMTARHEALAVLSSAASRARAQQALSAALSVASTVDQVVAAIVAHVTEVFDAVGAVVVRLMSDNATLEIMRAGAMPDHIRDEWRRFPLAAPVPLAEVARTGEPIFLESRDQWTARYPDMAPLLDATGHQANAVTPLVVDGEVLGVLGVAFDAPRPFSDDERTLARAVALQCAQSLERARLFDAERVARTAAEQANQAKAQFLAVMSHELRTPLNAIGGYAELLEMGIRGPVTTTQCEDLRRIRSSQQHLLGLINNLLNYARLESGSVRYDVEAVGVCDAVAAAEALVAPQVRSSGLTLIVRDCPSDLVVRADPERLRQILVNLLSNAVKFTDREGTVELTCEASQSVEQLPRVRICVRDTGIGIPANKLAAIFEPFVQVSGDLTRSAEGTGLGLAISRDLARGMGGDLTVESEAGAGSMFTLTLPRG